jgi:hypothetical protein
MQPTEMLVAIVATTGAFSATAYLAYVVLQAIRSRQQARLTGEFQAKLLERVGSAQELGAFLSSEGGARMLASLSPARTDGGPHRRILRALQAGFVLLALGIGLFIYVGTRTLPMEGEDAIAMMATVAAALGVGSLIAAAASYEMSRRMGLLNSEAKGTGPAHLS